MKEQDFIGRVLPTCRVFEEAYAQIRFTFGCKMLSEPSTRFHWCETGYTTRLIESQIEIVPTNHRKYAYIEGTLQFFFRTIYLACF